jgi:hypothetical protein
MQELRILGVALMKRYRALRTKAFTTPELQRITREWGGYQLDGAEEQAALRLVERLAAQGNQEALDIKTTMVALRLRGRFAEYGGISMSVKLSVTRKKVLDKTELQEIEHFQRALTELGLSSIKSYFITLSPAARHRSIQHWKQQAQEGNPWHSRVVSAVLAMRLVS